jgi:Arc/MetJ family transcription regulator
MRKNIEIDDGLMAEAQKVSGQATKKQHVEEALRLMVRLRRQQQVGAAFGKFRWRGNLARSRKGRARGAGSVDRGRQQCCRHLQKRKSRACRLALDEATRENDPRRASIGGIAPRERARRKIAGAKDR